MAVAPEAVQPVIILKEGTERTRGRDARRANIMAARIVAEAVRTSLGPKGMDKMLVDSFGDVTITNDGATMLDEMDIQHPAAKMMVEVAKAQDDEVGDGTTTVVVLAGELLGEAEKLIEKDIHPTVVIDGYEKAAEKAVEILDEIAIKVDPLDREYLKKVAMTSMASKLVSGYRDYLADLVVDAVLQIVEEKYGEYEVDLDYVKIEKKYGESVTDTQLVKGLVIDKEVVHPGMPKRIEDARIALLNCPLEIEKTEIDAEIRIRSPEAIKAFLDQETEMLRDMVKKIKASGANVVFCQKGIDDMAQHFLAKQGILAARRIKKSDMEKLARATGARIVTNIDELSPEDLGHADLVEERKVADEKMIFVEGCKNPKAVSILIRGGSERIVDEAERSVKDALNVVRDVIIEPKILAGGGAPEAELARRLRRFADTLTGKERLAVSAFADAVEAIPVTLAENAGMDPVDTVSELRSGHEAGEVWAGVDVYECKVRDMREIDVYEPLLVKKQVIKSATEAAVMLLKIDDVIAAAKVKPPKEAEKGEEETEF